MLIDMHSHILPGADHGSDSIETSLEQIKRAKKAGVSAILATPHYYHHNDNIDDFLRRREKTYKELRDAMDKNGFSDIQVFLGAEVRLEVDLMKEPRIPELCIQGTKHLLLEMPFDMKWTDWIYNSVYEVAARFKVNPIIAHIDRYEEKPTKKLMEMGVDAQINASSMCHFSSRRKMMKYVRDGQVKFLGSDIHGPKSPEYDEFAKAVKHLGDYAEDIMENSAQVLGIKPQDSHRQTEDRTNGLIF